MPRSRTRSRSTKRKRRPPAKKKPSRSVSRGRRRTVKIPSRSRSRKKTRKVPPKKTRKAKSRSRSRSKSLSQTRSRSLSRTRSKSAPKTRGTAICIPAGNRVLNKNGVLFRPHYTMTYVKSNDFRIINAIKREIDLYVQIKIKPDNTGRYMGRYSNVKKWGKNSVLIEGPLETFKKNLHRHLTARFGNKIAPYRPGHVNLQGNQKAKLYPSFNLKQLTLEC